MYVAMTRAEKILYLTYAECRLKYGKISESEPSQFLTESGVEDECEDSFNAQEKQFNPYFNPYFQK